MSSPVYLGIDIGTTGIRASIIDDNKNEVLTEHISFSPTLPIDDKNEQSAESWRQFLHQLLEKLSTRLNTMETDYKIKAIAIDGTSSTLIACKKDGTALSPALMYNDQQSQQQAQYIKQNAASNSAVFGASSSLAKALNLLESYPETEIFCHQADWLASALTGKYGISDENNCLKFGYDSSAQEWPQWLIDLLPSNFSPALLPDVVAPGTIIAEVKPDLIKKYTLDKHCKVVAGTTDSNAAVLATGINQTGDAVTSLGSTLVLKLFSDKPIFDAESGIYSHRLNGHWLVGGASNSGGAVLLLHFSAQQLEDMTSLLKPEQKTGLKYYPLPATGERFPINDCNKKSIVEPKPESDIEFFQGLLEGIANIEAEGYKKLQALGASPIKKIVTAGGGSKNQAWNKIREQATGVSVSTAKHSEASYGSALLARKTMKNEK